MLLMNQLVKGTEIGCGSTTLIAVQCWCGLWHAIPAQLHRMANDDKKAIYCPLGHTWYYTKSRAEQLAQELRETHNRLAAEQARHDQTKASLRAHQGVVTRMRNRIHKGVCPHCNRYFKDLHAHMTTKHGRKMTGDK